MGSEMCIRDRFARVLSALCLNSPLRGSDSGSGAETSQTSRRKPCYRQSDLFSNSSWLYYFTHHVLQCSSSAHCQKLLACRGSLKRNIPFRPNYKTRKNRDTVTVVNFRHCASVFFVLYTRKLMRKALVLKPVCVHWRCGRLFPASV